MPPSWEAIDLRVLEWINQRWVTPAGDVFFVWLTDPPHREVYFVAAGLALMILGRRRGVIAALTLAVAITLTDQLIAEVLKPAFDRVRPVFAHPDEVRFLLERQARSPSMPSAHAANSFAVAVILWEFRRWLGWGALGLAILVAYSRPYVGVHYPSDILVGACLGTLIALSTIGARRGIVRIWRRKRGEMEPALVGGTSPQGDPQDDPRGEPQGDPQDVPPGPERSGPGSRS